jgi:hypothetical protein
MASIGPSWACDDGHSAGFLPTVTCLLLGNAKRDKIVSVSRIRAAVVLGAALLWAATPAMACLLSGFVQTQAERECCHHMPEHCGQSAMPATHACCQAPIHPETVVTPGRTNSPRKNMVAAVPAMARVLLPAVNTIPLRSLAFFESPPGQAAPGSSSVLRI